MPACLLFQEDQPIVDRLLEEEPMCQLELENVGSCLDFLPWTCQCGEALEIHSVTSQKPPAKAAVVSSKNNATSTASNSSKDFIQKNSNSGFLSYQFHHYNQMELYMEQYRQHHTVLARMLHAAGVSSANTNIRGIPFSNGLNTGPPTVAAPSQPDPWIKPRIPPLTHSSSVDTFGPVDPYVKIDTVGFYPLTSTNLDNDRAFISVSGFAPKFETSNHDTNAAVGRRISDGSLLTQNGRGMLPLRRESSGVEAARESTAERANRPPLVRDGSSVEFASVLQERLRELQRQQQMEEYSSKAVTASDTSVMDISMARPLKILPSTNRVTSMKRIVPNHRGAGGGGGGATGAGGRGSGFGPGSTKSIPPRVREIRLWHSPALDSTDSLDLESVSAFVTVTSCTARPVDSHKALRESE